MIRKFPGHDTMTPAGQIVNKYVAQEGPYKAPTAPKEATHVTWHNPWDGMTPQQAYEAGWADAMAEVEFNQWLDNRSN